MRLIDAKALFNDLADYWGIPKDWDGQIEQTCEDALSAIENAPTVEAELVVYANWVPFIEDVEIYNAGGFTEKRQTGWTCSHCGQGYTQFGHQKRCGDCGAHMDKVAGNG